MPITLSPLTPGFACEVGDLDLARPVTEEDLAALRDAFAPVARLVAHATDRRFTCLHRWRVGDLVMRDNLCTMNGGTEFDDTRWPRDMQRATRSDAPDAFDQALRAAGFGTAAEDAMRSAQAVRATA